MILDYEERWRPTHVRVLRSTPGGPHLPPPAPLPLPRCGRGRGEDGPHLPPSPPSSPTLWARKGGGQPSPSPPAPLPLPRCGRGRGEDGPHLPPSSLPLLHGERPGGDEQSSSDPAPASHQITPLPQRGRGAGGEGDQALRAGLNIPLGCGFGLLRQCFSSPLYLAVRLYLMQAARRKAVQ